MIKSSVLSWNPPPMIDLEPLVDQLEPNSIDFDQILYQTLVNDGKHIRILNERRPQFIFNEKQLRDAAAAEVARNGGYENHWDINYFVFFKISCGFQL